MIQKGLESKVFEREIDFKTLENILETLDHVTPKKLTRQEYNNLRGHFLVETGEDKFGKKYDLFLPEDLEYGELLYLIYFLSQKFGIENYTPYERIFTQTKVMIGIILRGLGNEAGQEELNRLSQKYNLPKDFIKKISDQRLKYSEAKSIIKSIKGKRSENKNEKIGKNNEDIVLGQEELKSLFGQQFDLTFFRKGVNMLRLGMMTLTQAEQEAKIRYCKESGFKKVKGNGRIWYTKGDEVILIGTETKELDKEERLLRESIGIDEFKRKLELAKVNGNGEVQSIEYSAIEKILRELHKFYYELRKNRYGYQPNKIWEYKEIYCVGFSILGHAFLSELGIRHNGLTIPRHSALKVFIGQQEYYFDATSNLNVVNFEEKKLSLGNYSEGEAEKVLLSHIYNNKGASLYILGRYKDSIEMYEKAIELDTKDSTAYNNKGSSLYMLGRYEDAIEMYEKAVVLNPKYSNAYNNKGSSLYKLGRYKEAIKSFLDYHKIKKSSNYITRLLNYTLNLLNGQEDFIEILYRKQKKQIKKLIENQDFEGLRLYLLQGEEK